MKLLAYAIALIALIAIGSEIIPDSPKPHKARAYDAPREEVVIRSDNPFNRGTVADVHYVDSVAVPVPATAKYVTQVDSVVNPQTTLPDTWKVPSVDIRPIPDLNIYPMPDPSVQTPSTCPPGTVCPQRVNSQVTVQGDACGCGCGMSDCNCAAGMATTTYTYKSAVSSGGSTGSYTGGSNGSYSSYSTSTYSSSPYGSYGGSPRAAARAAGTGGYGLFGQRSSPGLIGRFFGLFGRRG